jgi:hypothetical protein
MELWTFYRKIASRTGWVFVTLHFLEIKKMLKTLKFIAEKYGLSYQYEKWIQHPFLPCSYSYMLYTVTDFEKGIGKNYQNVLKKVFGLA